MMYLLPLLSSLFACANELIDMQQNHMVFFDSQKTAIEHTEYIDKQLYAQCVHTLPICCVDIFVYNPITRCYFLVLRNIPPAQNIYFFPGGRLYKGESFFECAQRKCREEAGLHIKPLRIIDVYNTMYPDGSWDCQTHTVNIAIFSVCIDDQASIDNNHGDYKWQSIDEIPEHSYLKDIYQKAIPYIHFCEPVNGKKHFMKKNQPGANSMPGWELAYFYKGLFYTR